mgnify:CR=1 FL=1
MQNYNIQPNSDIEKAYERKYLSSLIWLLKDLAKLALISGLIGGVVIHFLMGKPSGIEHFIAQTLGGIIIGIVLGYVIKCVFFQTNAAAVAGISAYNIFAGFHNMNIFAHGMDFFGLAYSIFMIIWCVIRFAFSTMYSFVLLPVNILYLCIMSILETKINISNSIGSVLDKSTHIVASIVSICLCIMLVGGFETNQNKQSAIEKAEHDAAQIHNLSELTSDEINMLSGISISEVSSRHNLTNIEPVVMYVQERSSGINEDEYNLAIVMYGNDSNGLDVFVDIEFQSS